MSVRTVIIALTTALVVPLAAVPARANSITTYGVIITAMGNELQVQTVDKPGGDSAASPGIVCPTNATSTGDMPATDVGGSLLVTPDGSGGINITPYKGGDQVGKGGDPSGIIAPPGKGAAGNDGGGTSDIGSGQTVTDTPPEVVPPKVEFDSTATSTTPGGTHLPPKPVDHTANTPEPASVTLLALAGVGGLVARRRRR
jgi:MYXO-CTERM domain-containing protein